MVTPAFAANTESAHTDLSLYIANDPVYTVTVQKLFHLMQKNIHKFRLQPRCTIYSRRQENFCNIPERKWNLWKTLYGWR